MKQSKEIIWQAPEYKYQHKDVSWYWISVIGVAILLLVAIWQKNLLFGVFVIIAEIMILFWAKRFPKILQFKIDKKGVHIGKLKSYDYENLIGFHIVEDDDELSELVLKTKNRLHLYIKILLLNDDIPKIKKALQEHLEEIEYEESLIDHLGNIIGF